MGVNCTNVAFTLADPPTVRQEINILALSGKGGQRAKRGDTVHISQEQQSSALLVRAS